jgi:hypothetical protein
MTDTERITNEVYDRYMADPFYAPIDEDPLAPAIGIRNGLILGIIFWGLALVAILLIRGCK